MEEKVEQETAESSTAAEKTDIQTKHPIFRIQNKTLLITVTVILILGFLGLSYFAFSRSQQPQPYTPIQSQPTQKQPRSSNVSETVTVTTNSGLTFSIPKSWGGRFYKNSANELRIEMSDWIRPEVKEETRPTPPSNYIQIEIFTTSKPLTNKYVTVVNSESITVNGLGLKKSVGKETFSAKGRDYEQFTWSDKSKTYVLAAYSPNIQIYESAISTLIQSIGKSKMSSASQSFLNTFGGLTVYAQEPTTQSGTTTEKFPGISFKELLPEAAPMEAQFTEQNGKWKGNRAQGYTFTALSDQRLTTIATEEADYSFIKSDLYDENGQLVKGDLDTRIEFTVPKTGKYFLIVQNIKNGTEKYNVRLQDRDQSDIVIKVKRYSDGAELFFPPEIDVITIPFSDFAFLANLNKVTDPSAITPIVYTQSGTREQFKEKAFFPEDSQGNIVKTTPSHLDNGAILVEPEDKSYPTSSQNVLSFSLGTNASYIYRIFTQ